MRAKFAYRTVALVALLTLAAPVHTALARSFLWKATGPQGVVYLVGSVHMLSKDYYPLSPALEASFNDSDLLVEEADLGEMLSPDSQFRMLSQGLLPESQTLLRVLSPATYALVSKRVGDLGMPIDMLQRFKPWFLALTIMSLSWQSSGLDPELGLDKHFYDRAIAEGKQVQGFETTEYQISRFDEMSMPQQDHLLAESITDLDTEQSNITKLADAWRDGDEPTVERIVLQGLKDDLPIYQRLLVDRNRNWLPKIESFFSRKGHTFVVVGAAHLVGPDGLLALLVSKGYSIEQL